MQIGTARKPRKWLTVWTYQENDHIIAQRLEDEVGVKFSDELKEIHVPKLMAGYIFLRVVGPSQDLLDAVKRISGVGGILHLANKNPLEAIKLQRDSFFIAEEAFVEGDLIEVAIGPLLGHRGRVVQGGHLIKVGLDVFGRLIRFDFRSDEICLCKDT